MLGIFLGQNIFIIIFLYIFIIYIYIFRPGHPYNMTGEKGKGDVHGRNSMRYLKFIKSEIY